MTQNNTIDKNYAFDEMMVHVPFCSHNNIQKILVIGNVSEYFKEQINKHQYNEIVFCDTLNIKEDKYDIILNMQDTLLDDQFVSLVDRYLEPTCGIFVTKSAFVFKDLEQVKKDLSILGKYFWISMPYSFGHNTLLFASKKYHPQAQIVLQVSDLLPDCQYYNTELHNASFVYPTYITKALTGIAKR